MPSYTATYSCEDNKIRVYATARLTPDVYARVQAAGYIWAPKQDCFIAPMWTPTREDLALELAGAIDDEETSLAERAEARADRFSAYSEKRSEEAASASARVHAIADMIPMGQPILVGHHSEKRARRDQERIQEGMGKAVSLSKAADYWRGRAASALAHATYKSRPAVRARRIKTLEADLRKQERNKQDAEKAYAVWTRLHEPDSLLHKDESPMSFHERVIWITRHTNTAPIGVYLELSEGLMTADVAQARCIAAAQQRLTWATRWIDHSTGRLVYEKTLLAGDGGTVAEQTVPELGGAVKCWVKSGQWIPITKVNKVSVTVMDNWGNGGGDFRRTVPFTDLYAVMSKGEYQAFLASASTG